jgi:hypothetical protein
MGMVFNDENLVFPMSRAFLKLHLFFAFSNRNPAERKD